MHSYSNLSASNCRELNHITFIAIDQKLRGREPAPPWLTGAGRGRASRGTDLAGAAGGGRPAREGSPSSPVRRSRRAARPCTASAAPSSPPRLHTPHKRPRTLPCCKRERENCKIIMIEITKNEYLSLYVSKQTKNQNIQSRVRLHLSAALIRGYS